MSSVSISIVLPVHGTERYLDRVFDSILGQTFTDFEAIFVNDCSPDNSQAIIDRYAAKDSRVRSVIHEVNKGTGEARNSGTAAARGKYLYYLDPDDLFHDPDSLGYLFERAERDGCDVLVGDSVAFVMGEDPYGDTTPQYFSHLLDSVSNISLKDRPVLVGINNVWNMLLRMDYVREKDIRFIPPRFAEDVTFSFSCLARARTLSVTRRPTYRYQVGRYLGAATVAKCHDARATNLSVLDQAMRIGDHGILAAVCEKVMYACSRAHWRERAAEMSREDRLRGLREWSEGLARIPADIFNGYEEEWAREYLRVVLAGDVEHALDMADSGEAARFRSVKPYARWHERMAETGDYYGLLRQNYRDVAPAPNSLRPLEIRPELTPVADTEPTIRWGTGPDEPISKANIFDATGRKEGGLRILTLSTRAGGGAGIGSLRRVEALRRIGHDARLVSLQSDRTESHVGRLTVPLQEVDVTDDGAYWKHLHQAMACNYLPGFNGHEFFSDTVSATDFRALSSLIDKADVVHLHWVAGMLDYAHMNETLKGRPVVWTCADMNAFTGGCHYSQGCDEFMRECRLCPMLGEGSTLAHEIWQRKKAAYVGLNLHVVCPSELTASLARKSSLLADVPVHVVDNAYPVERYVPLDKAMARKALGLPESTPLVLFGAEDLSNARKGGDIFLQAMAAYQAEYGAGDAEVLSFGQGTLSLGVPCRSLGSVDQSWLPVVYAAGDVYVTAAREDNAPLTVGESLLCGTPVVGFPTAGNLASLGRHEETVYVARHFDPEDMAKGLDWAIRNAGPELRRRCRQLAETKSDPAVAAAKHEAIYRAALSGNSVQPHADTVEPSVFSHWEDSPAFTERYLSECDPKKQPRAKLAATPKPSLSDRAAVKLAGMRMRSLVSKSGLFDAEYYTATYPDVAGAGMDPLSHFLQVGLVERRNPNNFFQLKWYAARYPEVGGSGLDPFVHYVVRGWKVGHDPGPRFSVSEYLRERPDVKKAGMEPLRHKLLHG